MISEAQFYQIEDARKLIGDPEVIRMISNPRLTAEQMQSLIALACSHPKALFDPHELSAADQGQMTLEIRHAVKECSADYLAQNKNYMPRISPRTEVMSLER